LNMGKIKIGPNILLKYLQPMKALILYLISVGHTNEYNTILKNFP
jgi:hypothetical protein